MRAWAQLTHYPEWQNRALDPAFCWARYTEKQSFTLRKHESMKSFRLLWRKTTPVYASGSVKAWKALIDISVD